MSDDDSGQSVNLPVSVATRVSSRDNERLEQYMEQEDLGKSVAARRLLRSGLEHELESGQSRMATAEAVGEGMLLTAGIVALLVLTDSVTGINWTMGAIALALLGYPLRFHPSLVFDRFL